MKDQYGNDILNKDVATWSAELHVTDEMKKDGIDLPFEKTGETSGEQIQLDASLNDGTKVGPYKIDVTASATDGSKTIKRSLSVTVKQPTNTYIPKDAAKFKIELNKNSVDLNPEVGGAASYSTTKKEILSKQIDARIAAYDGTVFVGYVDDDTNVYVSHGGKAVKDNLWVTAEDKFPIPVTSAAILLNVADVSGTAVNLINTIGEGIPTAVPQNGTYTVSADDVNEHSVSSATFTVKNTMELPTITALSSSYDTITSVFKVDNDVLADEADTALKLMCGPDFDEVKPDDKSGRYSVRYVKVLDTFRNVDYYYYVPFSRTLK